MKDGDEEMRVNKRGFFALYYDLLYSHGSIKAETDFLEEVFKSCSLVEVKESFRRGMLNRFPLHRTG